MSFFFLLSNELNDSTYVYTLIVMIFFAGTHLGGLEFSSPPHLSSLSSYTLCFKVI